jgi:hypothetical protein
LQADRTALRSEGTPVTEDYRVPAQFTGRIEGVTIEVKPIAAADEKAVEQDNGEGLAKPSEFE